MDYAAARSRLRAGTVLWSPLPHVCDRLQYQPTWQVNNAVSGIGLLLLFHQFLACKWGTFTVDLPTFIKSGLTTVARSGELKSHLSFHSIALPTREFSALQNAKERLKNLHWTIPLYALFFKADLSFWRPFVSHSENSNVIFCLSSSHKVPAVNFVKEWQRKPKCLKTLLDLWKIIANLIILPQTVAHGIKVSKKICIYPSIHPPMASYGYWSLSQLLLGNSGVQP